MVRRREIELGQEERGPQGFIFCKFRKQKHEGEAKKGETRKQV